MRDIRLPLLIYVVLLLGISGYGPNQGVSDHRELANSTAQNDHTQYLMRDGSNAMTGTFTGVSGNFSADITATRGWIGGVQLSGGSAFFGTEHSSTTGVHTNVNANAITSTQIAAAAINITSTITAIPNGNGVGVSGGNLVAEVADGLGFGSGNITPSWGTATPATINDETGTAGSVSEFSRRDHRHPVVYATTAEITDVSGTTESAGTSSKFTRGDHQHQHPVIGTGDLHTQYILADGTRAFTGNQPFAGYQLQNPRLEQFATGSEPTPGSGTKGRFWLNSSLNVMSFDDGTNRARAYEPGAGAGMTASDSNGIRTINVIAGLGIVVNANDLQIDTGVVPQLAQSNTFIGTTNTFRQIVPQVDDTYTLGSPTLAWQYLYVSALATSSGVIDAYNDIQMVNNSDLYPAGGGSDLGLNNVPWNAVYSSAYYGSNNTSAAIFPAGIDVDVVATGSLPAAGAANDGRIIIEDAGAGDRNLIIYGGGQRFRIDGGAPF